MNDFDFYTGTWDIINRRRTDFLEDSCFVQEAIEWEEFPAVSTASRHLGGMANFDEVEFPTKGLRGVGRFVDGRGDFRGDDTIDGREIRVRYLWSDITATTAHWEQAFSVDGERTWITNWIMESTRR